MSVARKKPRCRSPSSLAKLAQCQGASRAHLLRRGRGACRSGGYAFVVTFPPRFTTKHRGRSSAHRDFHGAFFFRGRVRRVPLFSRKHTRPRYQNPGWKAKGRNEEHVGREPIFRGNEKPSRRLSPIHLHRLRRLTFLLSFCHYSLRCFGRQPSYTGFDSDEEICISTIIYLRINFKNFYHIYSSPLSSWCKRSSMETYVIYFR